MTTCKSVVTKEDSFKKQVIIVVKGSLGTSKQILDLNPPAGWDLSALSMPALFMAAWVFSRGCSTSKVGVTV